jgi:thiaminase/transcriptional activator TenA
VDAALDHAADAWGASYDHPFVRALVDGSLDSERFKFYQMQDARYLEAIADAFVQIGIRCSDPNDKLWFVAAAERALQTERSLHLHYGDQLGYGPADIRALILTPTNRAYQNHMPERTQRGTRLAALAAVAPCPWLYRDVGTRIWDELGGSVDDNHPYADWIRRYADPDPDESMNIGELTGRLDRWAQGMDEATQERALEAFATSTRYEWMFLGAGVDAAGVAGVRAQDETKFSQPFNRSMQVVLSREATERCGASAFGMTCSVKEGRRRWEGSFRFCRVPMV